MVLRKITKTSVAESCADLAERSSLDLDVILLTTVATAICFFGFHMNSSSVIIGAMVISPLLYSVVHIGVSIFNWDSKSVRSSLVTIIGGSVIAISVAALLTQLFPTTPRSEIIDRLNISLMDYFFVAVFSGIGGTFAFFWPNILDIVAGITISIALIPPMTMIGIGMTSFSAHLLAISGIIAVINILGICLGAFIAYASIEIALRHFSKITAMPIEGVK